MNNSLLSIKQPFNINYKRSSENSLPALSAIYGSSLDTYKNYNRRNNTGLAGLDLSNHRKRKPNYDQVYNTIDIPKYDKNNSLSLVMPHRTNKKLQESFSGKKSPVYEKRNMSFSNIAYSFHIHTSITQ